MDLKFKPDSSGLVPATYENVVAKKARISKTALASAGVHGSPGQARR
jgi:hypothetical protein